MATELLFAYPDIPLSSLTTTASQAMHALFPASASITGERNTFFRTNSSVSSLVLTYDLGSGNTRAVNHLIVARADVYTANSGSDIKLEGDDNSSFSSPEVWSNNTAVENATLYGQYASDYLVTGTASTAYRYWRITFTPSSSATIGASKIYFGSSFDIGVNPSDYSHQIRYENQGELLFHTGNKLLTRSGFSRYSYRLRWDGVTDAKRLEFCEKVLRNPRRDFGFLYTTSNHQILAGNRVAHVRIVPESTEIRSINSRSGAYHSISATFEELV